MKVELSADEFRIVALVGWHAIARQVSGQLKTRKPIHLLEYHIYDNVTVCGIRLKEEMIGKTLELPNDYQDSEISCKRCLNDVQSRAKLRKLYLS